MKLKTFTHEGVEYAVLSEGKPVYVGDDGKEIAFDAVHATATIKRLNGEAQGHREAKETAERALKAFEGIADPAKALEALNTVANLDAKKLVDAGEVEKVKAAAVQAVEERYKPIVEERDKLTGQLNQHIRGGAFSRSKFIADKVAVPVHMMERTYGDNFKVEDGKLVPYDANGSKIYSRARPGELADFDEALELLVTADPYKDHILKGTTGGGGGAGNGGGGSGGIRQMKRSEYNAMSAKDRAAFMDEVNSKKAELVD